MLAGDLVKCNKWVYNGRTGIVVSVRVMVPVLGLVDDVVLVLVHVVVFYEQEINVLQIVQLAD